MAGKFVGFYWTLPVNWANHRRLPKHVDAAAAASKTIRYQRERARKYVIRENGGTLEDIVGEFVFMDVRTDRASSLIRKPLMEAALVCDKHRAKLLYVNFQEHHYWRNNRYLRQVLKVWGIDRALPLSPIPIEIEGKEFNPHEHFEDWRRRDEQAMHVLDRRAREGLANALSEIPEQRGRWRRMADLLNDRAVKSFNGGNWTADNVRKHVKRGNAERAGQSSRPRDAV